MWTCSNCPESHDDDMLICWSCGTSVDGAADPNFRHASDHVIEDLERLRAVPRRPVVVELPPASEVKLSVGAERVQDQICGFCREVPGVEVTLRCSLCSMLMHRECLSENRDCPTLGCDGDYSVMESRPRELAEPTSDRGDANSGGADQATPTAADRQSIVSCRDCASTLMTTGLLVSESGEPAKKLRLLVGEGASHQLSAPVDIQIELCGHCGRITLRAANAAEILASIKPAVDGLD
jgi:hypothetical protein